MNIFLRGPKSVCGKSVNNQLDVKKTQNKNKVFLALKLNIPLKKHNESFPNRDDTVTVK